MRIIVFLIVFFTSSIIYAQSWVEKWEEPDANFYEIQKSFNDYWQDKEIERSKGWKQFKRWEYFMEPRVYPIGKLPAPDFVAREIKKYYRQQNFNRTINSNANWQAKGPANWLTTSYNPGLGRVNCVTVSPTDSNIVCIGSPSGGFWKSVDGGQHWFTTTDSLTVLGITAIAIHPSNPNIIYIGTGDGDAGDTYSIGVLVSIDGGYSWKNTGLNWQISQTRRISKILIHPINHDILLSATNNGVYKTIDAGMNWTLSQSGDFKDIEFKPGDPSTIYVCGRNFYKSTDTGDTFNQITSGIPSYSAVNRLAIAVTPANPDYVYMLAGSSLNSGFYGLYRSINSGSSFSLRSNSPNILTHSSTGSGTGGQSWYDLAIAASPWNADEIYTGGINIWKSHDGGVNWTINAYWYYPDQSIPYVHADIHSLDFYGSTLYSGCDGGIFKTPDGGASWHDLSAGLQITQFYRIGGYPGDSELVIGGTQDNGTNKYDSGIWTHVLGADGMEAAIDYTNPLKMYACIQNGGLRRSDNGGLTFANIVNNITETGAWVTPYVLHPTDPNTIYAGFQNVWESKNQGNFWKSISTFTGSIRSLAISQADPNYIYAANYTSIYRTSDGGNSWLNISASLPVSMASLTYIAVSDSDPEKVWVTFSGFAEGNKVYASTDGGNNWINISGTLPNIPVNCIVHKSNSNDGLYIGTDNGVFYNDGFANDWQPFNTGLPNVIVQELEIHESSKTIKAATYGRGLWESPLADYGATIVHIPLKETEDVIGPYEVVAEINPGSSPLVAESLRVYFGIDTLFSSFSTFTPSGNPNEYIANIPSQGSGVTINYYISVIDSVSIHITSPLEAPSTYYSFYAGQDTIAPILIHTPVTTANILELPVSVSAQSSDNLGIDRVWVEFELNSTQQPSFDLSTIDNTNFSGYFPFDSTQVSIGDVITYRVSSKDSSLNVNMTMLGDFEFNIEKILEFNRFANLAIPNNDTIGIFDTLIISGQENQKIVDINVSFKSFHTNFGDLVVKLISPDKTVITLIDRPGFPGALYGNPGNNPDIILNDESVESIEDVTFQNSENVTGSYAPFPDSLYLFDGNMVNGSWVINVSDITPPFAGNLQEWGLIFSVDNITALDAHNNIQIPQEFVLLQNYPNPFNPVTTIEFQIPNPNFVTLKLYNILGQEVATLVSEKLKVGSYKYFWDASIFASGIYLYRMEAGKFKQTKKLVLLR